MNTIDEAIKHCEEVAEKNEESIAYYTIQGDKEWLDECEKDCIEYAKEHRQLAKWLKELKHRRSYEKKMDANTANINSEVMKMNLALYVLITIQISLRMMVQGR